MTAGGGTYLLEDRRARGAGRRLHLHGAVLPAVLRRRRRALGVPALQGRLARRFLSDGAAQPFVQTARPRGLRRSIPPAQSEKGKPAVRRGRKARGLRLGDGSAAGLLTTTSCNQRMTVDHLTRRPPALRPPWRWRCWPRRPTRPTRRSRRASRRPCAATSPRSGNTVDDLPRRRRQLRRRPGRRRVQQQRLRRWRYVDVDADATTFDSSSATVALPAGSTVLWAGLYWAGDTTAGTGGEVAARRPRAAAPRA